MGNDERPKRREGAADKDLSDPSYNAADFRKQLLGGDLFWLSAVLAVVALGYTIYVVFSPTARDIGVSFPFRARGGIVPILSTGAAIIWATLAAVNWRNRKVKR
jgi:hypothetical protein